MQLLFCYFFYCVIPIWFCFCLLFLSSCVPVFAHPPLLRRPWSSWRRWVLLYLFVWRSTPQTFGWVSARSWTNLSPLTLMSIPPRSTTPAGKTQGSFGCWSWGKKVGVNGLSINRINLQILSYSSANPFFYWWGKKRAGEIWVILQVSCFH